MNLSVFEWIVVGEMTLLLFVFWNSDRRVRGLLVQALNSLNATRTAVETTTRSYLGIESAWEGMHREMGDFGTRGMDPITRERMGAIFVQMLDELKRIRHTAAGPLNATGEEKKGEKQ